MIICISGGARFTCADLPFDWLRLGNAAGLNDRPAPPSDRQSFGDLLANAEVIA